MNNKYQTEDISLLIQDRAKFDSVVYTPLSEAMEEITLRWNDLSLKKNIEEYLKNDIPVPFIDEPKFVIFRHLCTPNYELHRFISIADAFEWKPVFGEYPQDKFTPNNLSKYFLGKMGFHFGFGKKGGQKVKYINVIDFNNSNGKSLSALQTLQGQNLKDFHRELFNLKYPQYKEESNFFDSSEWFKNNGNVAKEYYKNFLALFIRNGILFENFLLTGSEGELTNNYFFPAFMNVWKTFGLKPLIVALEPTDIENDEFWMCHPSSLYDHVSNKIEN